MKKILFINHKFHLKTKSNIFVQEILKSKFEVKVISIDPSVGELPSFEKTNLDIFDCVILFQLDYLGSYFLKRNKPTIVIPMYDASGPLKDSHWNVLKKALVISFSLEIHRRVQTLGLESLYIRYYPKLKNENLKITNDEKKLKVFFWERLPDTNINEDTIIKLINNLPIESLHIHEAHDPNRKKSKSQNSLNSFPITRSKWFKDKNDLIQKIIDSDIYIAPRYSEGIGQGFLEAMSFGCCVIANDDCTHNEYIDNWVNGILVNFYAEDISEINSDILTIKNICKNSFASIKKGRQNWDQFYSKLFVEKVSTYIDEFEKNYSKDNILPKKMDQYLSKYELEKLTKAHVDWKAYYEYVEELFSEKVEKMSIMHKINRLEESNDINEALNILKNTSNKFSEKNIYDLIIENIKERTS